MAGPKHKDGDEESDVVRALLSQPVKSLEALINQLEGQIADRRLIGEEFQSSIGTRKLNLQERLTKLAYATPFDPRFTAKRDAEQEVLELDRRMMQETLDSFKEISLLQSKLLEAQSQLQRELQKLRLMESDNANDI